MLGERQFVVVSVEKKATINTPPMLTNTQNTYSSLGSKHMLYYCTIQKPWSSVRKEIDTQTMAQGISKLVEV